jgi:RNA polymerase sigma factor (sigma-70 family)
MVRFASRSLRNTELAEEVVQDALMELYKELVNGRAIEHPKAWVMRVVRRRVWRYFGAHADDQLEHEPLDVVDALGMAARASSEATGELALLLGCLTPREAEAVLLRSSGLDYAQIAAELELSSGTVGTLLSRALRKMQQVAQTETSTRSADETTRH